MAGWPAALLLWSSLGFGFAELGSHCTRNLEFVRLFRLPQDLAALNRIIIAGCGDGSAVD